MNEKQKFCEEYVNIKQGISMNVFIRLSMISEFDSIF